jgi:hypothetical protein
MSKMLCFYFVLIDLKNPFEEKKEKDWLFELFYWRLVAAYANQRVFYDGYLFYLFNKELFSKRKGNSVLLLLFFIADLLHFYDLF